MTLCNPSNCFPTLAACETRCRVDTVRTPRKWHAEISRDRVHGHDVQTGHVLNALFHKSYSRKNCPPPLQVTYCGGQVSLR